MNGVDVGDFGGADHLWNVQVTLARTRRPNAHGFIRKAHVQRVAVRLGIDRDRGDTQFLARIDHAQGDLTAIGYEDFSKHFRPKVAQASQAAERLAFLSFRAMRGISLFLTLNQREIPRIARNDKIKDCFRTL